VTNEQSKKAGLIEMMVVTPDDDGFDDENLSKMRRIKPVLVTSSYHYRHLHARDAVVIESPGRR